MKKSKLWAKFKIREELHRWWGVEGGIDEDGIKYVLNIIDQLDEPEVLSQDWVDKYQYVGTDPNSAFVYVKDLQNLLVPKQEELETKIHELIESYKQEEGAYSNPENGWISGFIEDLKNLVEKEQLHYALIKGHELTDGYDIYWNVDRSDCGVFVSRLHPLNDNFITEMSKEAWNELGINDSNADLIKVEE